MRLGESALADGIGAMHATARVVVLPRHDLGPTDVMLELGGAFELPISGP